YMEKVAQYSSDIVGLPGTVNRSLPLRHDRRQTPIVLMYVAQRLIRIVIEQARPTFMGRLRNEFLFRFDSLNGIEVISHHPGKRDMSPRRHQVGESKQRPTVSLKPRTLH